MKIKQFSGLLVVIQILFIASFLFTGCDTNFSGCGNSTNDDSTDSSTTSDETASDTSTALDGSCVLNCSTEAAADCATPKVRVTEVNVGVTVVTNESETQLKPIALAALPSGGSWLAWMSNDGRVYVARLDCNDQLIDGPVSFAANDFQDIIANDDGGVLLLTRDAQGGGTLNCGEPANLCDGGPTPPIACYGMYMVGFDCTGEEVWATQLTTQNSSLPPYSTGPSGPMVHMVWWYQHHGRLAFDGQNTAAYFCEALSVSQSGCINIHQGDRMQVVNADGTLLSGYGEIDWGCSHSWNTRIIWDPSSDQFEMVCATDRNGGIATPENPGKLIYSAKELSTLSIGDITTDDSGGYWLTASDQGKVFLMRLKNGTVAKTTNIGTSSYSKLAAYDSNLMVAGWGSGSAIKAVVLDLSDGHVVGDTFNINVPNNIYQPFKAYPDGSVAYAAAETGSKTIRIARVLPCSAK